MDRFNRAQSNGDDVARHKKYAAGIMRPSRAVCHRETRQTSLEIHRRRIGICADNHPFRDDQPLGVQSIPLLVA